MILHRMKFKMTTPIIYDDTSRSSDGEEADDFRICIENEEHKVDTDM